MSGEEGARGGPKATPGTGLFAAALIAVLVAGYWLQARYSRALAVPFADTNTYLDVGRNWFRGSGFVTTYNVVFGWSGRTSYPGLGYYNPLGALWFGSLWEVTGTPGAFAILATVVPCVVNALLVGLLVRRTAGRAAAVGAAALSMLLPSARTNIDVISLEHVTVTVCLAAVFLIARATADGTWRWLAAGALLAAGTLLKVTVLPVLPFVAGAVVWIHAADGPRAWRRARRPLLLLATGAAAVLLPYQIACIVATGAPYPQYPAMARLWGLGKLHGGTLVASSPAVRPLVSGDLELTRSLGNVFGNLALLVQALARDLGVFLLAPLAWLAARRRLHAEERLLLAFGTGFLLAYAVAFYWYPFSSDPYSPTRYVLHASAFFAPCAVAWTASAIDRRVSGPIPVAVVAVAALLAGFAPAIASFATAQSRAAAVAEPRVRALQRFTAACRELTRPNDLVAIGGGSYEMFGAMLLERPIVSLPEDAMDTDENLRLLIEIYRPVLIVPGRSRAAWRVAPAQGYRAVAVPPAGGGTRTALVFLRRTTSD